MAEWVCGPYVCARLRPCRHRAGAAPLYRLDALSLVRLRLFAIAFVCGHHMPLERVLAFGGARDFQGIYFRKLSKLSKSVSKRLLAFLAVILGKVL